MKKVRWGVVFITLFFLLFLTVAGYGFYLFQGQLKQIQILKEKLKVLDRAQQYTRRLLGSAKTEIKDLQLNLGSLKDELKEQVNIFNQRLSGFNERITAQEGTTKDIVSKLRDITSKVWSLEDKFHALKSKEVNLGDISVEKK
ncbi:MAG TPA: hypothetical protein ENI31_00360 [Candidatus Omnitrophica bacterium]|nr:MAG: hypothetical protein DRP61_00225 [Candidatus Omnitrophota bacterium]RKY35412.1 MAG: hypothetical protein DRP69_01665 [Candidatus Omnitrophota bacterium]RKY44899.1 MAG: hypothetical protein DRP80_00890 [Candidatus Omnitrophota bacterium]HEC68731.1 hypothetical protein [Candidatus Omnitrophota bacterium]